LLATACAPVPTVTPSPTPIPTITPTATPDPLHPILDALLQERIGTTADGLSEGQLLGLTIVVEDDEAIPVAGAFFDESGQFLHIQKGTEEIVIPVEEAADRLELKEGEFLIVYDETGFPQAVFDAENADAGWIFIDPEAGLAGLPDELKLALAPDTITVTLPPTEEGGEGQEVELTKSNISSVFPNLILYRDADGNAQKVMDIETGDVMDLREAGIDELDLKDGGKLEVRLFESIEDGLRYVAQNAYWFEGDRMAVAKQNRLSGVKEKVVALNHLLMNIDLNASTGIYPPFPEKDHYRFFYAFFLQLVEEGVEDGVVVNFLTSADGDLETVKIDRPGTTETVSKIREILIFDTPDYVLENPSE
jgi:hypothetical protein